MSKKYRNDVVARSGCTSSDSDDEICFIGEIAAKSSREYCHSIVALSDSESDFTMKRRHEECSKGSDSESESNKYQRMKKSSPEFYKRGNNKQTDKPEELFVIDKNSQLLVEDEFHVCEAVKRMEGRMRSAAKERYPEVNGHGSESSRVSDRYPPVPLGMRRLKIRDESLIQQDVDRLEACPGLEHVTEIRGEKRSSYFCGVCDRPFDTKKDIVSHLKNDMHKVKSLKALRPEWYRTLKNMPKTERKHVLYDMLSRIQDQEGIGKIVVEREYSDADSYKAIQYLDTPGTSSDNASITYCSNTNSDLVLSDCSKSDYFCWACECNMFDINLWESHAKKRSRSLRKYPMGKAPKFMIEKRPKTEAILVDRVNIPNGEPMVGLDYIREFQHIEAKKETYHCMLCGDCLSCIDITQHAASLQHRKKYLESINHYSTDHVNSLNMSENRTYYRIEDICRTHQNDYGSGCPEVYFIKSAKKT